MRGIFAFCVFGLGMWLVASPGAADDRSFREFSGQEVPSPAQLIRHLTGLNPAVSPAGQLPGDQQTHQELLQSMAESLLKDMTPESRRQLEQLARDYVQRHGTPDNVADMGQALQGLREEIQKHPELRDELIERFGSDRLGTGEMPGIPGNTGSPDARPGDARPGDARPDDSRPGRVGQPSGPSQSTEPGRAGDSQAGDGQAGEIQQMVERFLGRMPGGQRGPGVPGEGGPQPRSWKPLRIPSDQEELRTLAERFLNSSDNGMTGRSQPSSSEPPSESANTFRGELEGPRGQGPAAESAAATRSNESNAAEPARPRPRSTQEFRNRLNEILLEAARRQNQEGNEPRTAAGVSAAWQPLFERLSKSLHDSMQGNRREWQKSMARMRSNRREVQRWTRNNSMSQWMQKASRQGSRTAASVNWESVLGLGVVLVFLVVVGLLLRHAFGERIQHMVRTVARRAAWRPSRIESRAELVAAVDAYVQAQFGFVSRWWHSRRMLDQMLRRYPGHRTAIESLVRDYESARYAPEAARLTARQLESAAETLRQLWEVECSHRLAEPEPQVS